MIIRFRFMASVLSWFYSSKWLALPTSTNTLFSSYYIRDYTTPSYTRIAVHLAQKAQPMLLSMRFSLSCKCANARIPRLAEWEREGYTTYTCNDRSRRNRKLRGVWRRRRADDRERAMRSCNRYTNTHKAANTATPPISSVEVSLQGNQRACERVLDARFYLNVRECCWCSLPASIRFMVHYYRDCANLCSS